jgi:hypothetical protein
MKALLILLGMTLSLTSFAYDSGIMSAGWTHTCAIDHEGLKCWGLNNFGQTMVPPLKNPRLVSAGGEHSCALDDEGVKCWGRNVEGQTKVPSLKNPRLVSAGNWHTCALDDEGVKCWGRNVEGQTKVPSLKNPRLVSVGNHTCALDDEGVKCWGNNYSGQNKVPPLKNPRLLSAGGWYTCALDDEGVKCWGRNVEGQTKVPSLKNPRLVSAGNHACALDDEGVKCWGENSNGQGDVPVLTFGPSSQVPEFVLKDIATFFNVVALGSSPAKTKILSDLSLYGAKDLAEEKFSTFFQKTELASARYTLAALIEPVMKSADSGYYLEKVIPAYEVSIENIHGELGIRGLDDVFDLKAVREVALKVIQVNLNVASEFLTISERKDLQETNRLLGAAMADANNRDKVFKALDSVDNCKRILSKLENSSKTAFVFNTLYTASEFLERKIR